MTIIDWTKVAAITGLVSLGCGGLGFLWLIASIFRGMRDSLHTIATNDLPHIYAEIRDIRQDFLNYIISEDKRGQATTSYRRGDPKDPAGERPNTE